MNFMQSGQKKEFLHDNTYWLISLCWEKACRDKVIEFVEYKLMALAAN